MNTAMPQEMNRVESAVVRYFGGWGGAIAFVILLLACCLTRLLGIGDKAIMHDEALFTYYSYEQLYLKIDYRYMPILHGPLHLMLQAFLWHITGVSDFTMRLMVALMGIGGFFWIWTMRPWLGRVGIWVALTFYVLSPGVTNFARFFREDGVFVFLSLWIVTSGAHWWRSASPRWLASFIFAVVLLFCNKESSLFVYFSIVTFLVLMLLGDVSTWFFDGKAKDLPVEEFRRRIPAFPNPILPTLLFGGFIVLCLTQCFEGITYDLDVKQTLKHDFALRDVRSIPMALGWTPDLPESSGAGIAGTGKFWRMFYGGLALGLVALFALMKLVVDYRIGHRELTTRFWVLTWDARFYVWGALAGGLAIYLFIFTTYFKFPMGPFKIYQDTWAYWGGQHEWGRIGGPFHMHSVNLLVYELPSVLIVGIAWLIAAFKLQWTRSTGVALLLTAAPAAAFHVLLFSKVGVMTEDVLTLLPLTYFKTLVKVTGIFAVLFMVAPRAARLWFPLLLVGLTGYSLEFFHSAQWSAYLNSPIYQDGAAVMIKGSHASGATFLEHKLNMDGGWNLWFVMVLVVFVTVLSWRAIEEGRKFHGFLLWWFVTALGAASYAREAVPQVGIHAALPLVLLAGSYADRLWHAASGRAWRGLWIAIFGVFVLWNAKANLVLNLRNPDDTREKMVYGHTAPELMWHARMVTDYHRIASLRTNMVTQGDSKPMTEEWIANNNDPKRQRDMKVLVKGEAIWPLRWYFRNIDWTEYETVDRAMDQKWPFMFLDSSELSRTPRIAEEYHVFRGRSRTFWTPDPVDMRKLFGGWKLTIPGHYLDESPQAYPAWEAKQQWNQIRDYLLFRHTFDGGSRWAPAVSGVPYIFCVRKDLP